MDQPQVARLLYLSALDNHLDYFRLQKSFPYTHRSLAQKRHLARLFKKSHLLPGLAQLNHQLLAFFLNTYVPGKDKVEMHLIQGAVSLLASAPPFQQHSVLYQLFVSLLESNKHNYALHFQILLHFLLHLHLADKTQVLHQLLESQIYRFENINNPRFQLLCARLLPFGKRFNKEYFQKDFPRENPFFLLQYSEYLFKKKHYGEAYDLLNTAEQPHHPYLLHLQLFKLAKHQGLLLDRPQRNTLFQASMFQSPLFYSFMIYCVGLDYSALPKQEVQLYQDQLLTFALQFLEINSCSIEVLSLLLKLFAQFQQNNPQQYAQLLAPFQENILQHQFENLLAQDLREYLVQRDLSKIKLKLELLGLTFPQSRPSYVEVVSCLK